MISSSDDSDSCLVEDLENPNNASTETASTETASTKTASTPRTKKKYSKTSAQHLRQLELQRKRRQKKRENCMYRAHLGGQLREIFYKPSKKTSSSRSQPKKTNKKENTIVEPFVEECLPSTLPSTNELPELVDRDILTELTAVAEDSSGTISSSLKNNNVAPNVEWHSKINYFQELFVDSHVYLNQLCSCNANLASSYISCNECMANFCFACDYNIHVNNPFHQRVFFNKTRCIQLKPMEAVINLKIEIKDVPVPLKAYKPCRLCGSKLCVTAAPETVAVITQNGRFDLNVPKFWCATCKCSSNAEAEDYISNRFWPASPKSPITYLFCFKLLNFWKHLKFLAPGTSEQKFVETLSALSEENGRPYTINGKLFHIASQTFDAVGQITQEVVNLKNDVMCRACTGLDGKPEVLAGHVDGNHKLVRRKNNKQKETNSFYSGKIITSKKDFEDFKEKIDMVKPQASKVHGRCGSSEFQAAKEVSKRFRSLDETGIVMGSCTHGVILHAVNMHVGETYRHTMFIHNYLLKLGCKFLVNDVVCMYWPFAESVGRLLPDLQSLTKNMQPFLSYVHGQAHDIYCRLRYFGHWKEGAAGTLGEEQEQVFSTFSRYYNVTHTMSESGRNDHLSSAMFYWNRRKEKGLPEAITKRLLTATHRARFYRSKLDVMLSERKIKEDQLEQLKSDILQLAESFKGKTDYGVSNEIRTIQRKLEEVYFQYINTDDEIKSIAVNSKMRKVLRQKRNKLKNKAIKLIDKLNEKEDYDWGEDEFFQGIFPWDTLSNRDSFKKDIKIIDCWMFWKRNVEQQLQSKKEMAQYQSSLKRQLQKLKDKIETEKKLDTKRHRARFLLMSLEIQYLQNLLEISGNFSRFFENSNENDGFLNDEGDSDSDDEFNYSSLSDEDI